MPEEPNRPIEQQLEAYARQRRDAAGGPFELPPATRRLLQDQVARAYGRCAAGRHLAGGWLEGLWPRFAWVAPAFALVVVGAVIWRSATHPPRRETPMTEVERLAKLIETGPSVEKESLTEAAEAAGEPARALTPARPPAVDRGRDAGPSVRSVPATDAAWPPPQPPAIAEALPPARQEATPILPTDSASARPGEPSQRLARSERESNAAARPGKELAPADQRARAVQEARMDRRARATSDGVKPGETGSPASTLTVADPFAQPVPAGPPPTPALAGRFVQSQTATAQAVQFFQNTASAPNAVTVLNSFQMEQTGEQLRFIDADGSTYLGRWVDSADTAVVEASEATRLTLRRDPRLPGSPGATARAQSAAPAAAAQQSATAYHFVAQGTNRSLQQRVVIQGNYQVQTNLASAAPTALPQLNFQRPDSRQDRGVPERASDAGVAGGPAASVPARIQGLAVVGENTTIEIDAIPLSAPAAVPP